jgi:hypothetical protein
MAAFRRKTDGKDTRSRKKEKWDDEQNEEDRNSARHFGVIFGHRDGPAGDEDRRAGDDRR